MPPEKIARCMAPPEAWGPGEVRLDRDEAHYLSHVLRLRPGADVYVMDGHGQTGTGVLEVCSPRGACVRLTGVRRQEPVIPRLVLIQALIRGPRMDWLLQKAAELGVREIIVFHADHGVARIAPRDVPARLVRWRRIVREAARQCGTAWEPLLSPPRERLPPAGDPALPPLLCWGALTGTSRPLYEVLQQHARPPEAAGIVIGPEGDFSSGEKESLLRGGALPVTFGPFVLRAETAALCALGVMSCFWHAHANRGDARR